MTMPTFEIVQAAILYDFLSVLIFRLNGFIENLVVPHNAGAHPR